MPVQWHRDTLTIARTTLPAEAVLVSRNSDGSMTAMRLVLRHHSSEGGEGERRTIQLEADVIGTLLEEAPAEDSIGAQVLEAARQVMPGPLWL